MTKKKSIVAGLGLDGGGLEVSRVTAEEAIEMIRFCKVDAAVSTEVAEVKTPTHTARKISEGFRPEPALSPRMAQMDLSEFVL